MAGQDLSSKLIETVRNESLKALESVKYSIQQGLESVADDAKKNLDELVNQAGSDMKKVRESADKYVFPHVKNHCTDNILQRRGKINSDHHKSVFTNYPGN